MEGSLGSVGEDGTFHFDFRPNSVSIKCVMRGDLKISVFLHLDISSSVHIVGVSSCKMLNRDFAIVTLGSLSTQTPCLLSSSRSFRI